MIFNHMLLATQPIIDGIHQHPFNLELAKGTLAKETYLYYLQQDALYLIDYARALSITAARLPHSAYVQQFIQFALEAIKSERELHLNHLQHCSNQVHTSVQPNQACFMYTNYLLRMASLASIEEAVACLLPCFYIYHDVGKQMISHHSPTHPYRDWIALYASEAFETSVQLAISITNELGESASASTKTKMMQAFSYASQLEWLFWEHAYHQTNWMNETP